MQQNEFQKTWEHVLEVNHRNPFSIMEMLLQVQEKCGCVTEECIRFFAHELDMDEDDVHSMGTFYDYYTPEKQGKYVLNLCGGLACHLPAADNILRALRAELKLSGDRDTTEDGLFTVRKTGQCMGICGQGPVLKLNEIICPSMTVTRALKLVRGLKKQNGDEGIMDVVRAIYEESAEEE